MDAVRFSLLADRGLKKFDNLTLQPCSGGETFVTPTRTAREMLR